MINPNLRLIHWAKQYLGTREVGGENMGPEVERIQKAVDGKAMGEPWCCAFVQLLVQIVEGEFGIKSDLFRSENCWQTWERSRSLRVMDPEPGALIVWNKPGTIMGHIGVIRMAHQGTIITIEGNTNAKGSREGDGVHYQEWPRKSGLTLLGYLRVFPLEVNHE